MIDLVVLLISITGAGLLFALAVLIPLTAVSVALELKDFIVRVLGLAPAPGHSAAASSSPCPKRTTMILFAPRIFPVRRRIVNRMSWPVSCTPARIRLAM